MTAPPPVMRFNRVSVRDPMVNDIEGATLLVPDGWRLEGGFVWMPTFSMQANLLIRLTEPASGACLELLPAQQFCWPVQNLGLPLQPGSNWNGSVMLPPPQSPEEFLFNVYVPWSLPHLRGARVIANQDLPQLAMEATRAAGGGATARCNRLRLVYAAAGRPWEEDVYLTITFAAPNPHVAMWWCGGSACRAPAGRLEEFLPVMTAAFASVRLTLDWSAMLEHVRDLNRQGRRQMMADTQRLGQLAAQYREEARRLHQQVWDERQASLDRQNFARREVLGGVDTYTNPFDARPVELPAGYRDGWVSPDGTVILSTDPTYDPRPGSTADWRRMDRYRP